jgi:uncharacterized protein (TIGR02001 family)
MRNMRILAALGLLTAAGTASADISSTVTATSDYDFRGSSQSAKDPALQASLDYGHESGWYIGAWASNVDFGSESDIDYEVDLYTGFSGGDEDGLGWDVGYIYYAYPDDSDANYQEIYGKLSYSMFSGGLYYSDDWLNLDEGSALYATADASVPLPANFSLNLPAGYSFGEFFNDIDGEYIDYSLGVGYTAGNFELGLKYVDTDLSGDEDIKDDVFNTEGRVIFTISTTFPWASD